MAALALLTYLIIGVWYSRRTHEAAFCLVAHHAKWIEVFSCWILQELSIVKL